MKQSVITGKMPSKKKKFKSQLNFNETDEDVVRMATLVLGLLSKTYNLYILKIPNL